MSTWIKAGSLPVPELPPDRLSPAELGELRSLLARYRQAGEALAAAEAQLTLFVLTSRDRRGLRGEVKLDPETGALAASTGGPDAD
jgi:hypothetical protein